MGYFIRRFLGIFTNFINFGYGGCGRCKLTWNVTAHHSTQYDGGFGCFPLCEDCWQELTPETRLPYYRQLHDSWCKDGTQRDFSLMKDAVLKGN